MAQIREALFPNVHRGRSLVVLHGKSPVEYGYYNATPKVGRCAGKI